MKTIKNLWEKFRLLNVRVSLLKIYLDVDYYLGLSLLEIEGCFESRSLFEISYVRAKKWIFIDILWFRVV